MRMISPHVSQVLERINANTVCTGTQCFETPEDAGFGTYISPQPIVSIYTVFMLCAMVILALNPPSSLSTSKPRVDESRIHDMD